MKYRLDHALAQAGQVASRSQAESYIKLGHVKVNNKLVTKPGAMVDAADTVTVTATEQYVSRAGLKLASVVGNLGIQFRDKVMLDVGSSTGGFTDYALKHGARKSIAVELGSNQLHPSLHNHPQIELHEKTDINSFKTDQIIDIVVLDVSFISLRQILPHVATLCNPKTQVVAMVKPQFEAIQNSVKHKGVIKNDKLRREILKDFEMWVKTLFYIVDKADSEVSGAKGNQERFYLLNTLH